MEVKLLGTSAAEGWPALFCRCDACAKARRLGGKNIRTRASALIDNSLKIDFSPDTLQQIVKFDIDLQCLSGVLITHAHDDHFAPAELQYRGEHFVPTPINQPLPIYGPPEVKERLTQLYDLSKLPLTLITLEPWKTQRAGQYLITPILAQHDRDIACYNYIIEGPNGERLLYASDTGWYEKPTWRFLETTRLDGIVVEATKGMQEDGYMAHLCIPEVVRLRTDLIASGSLRPDAPVVATHLSHLCGLLHEELEAIMTPQGIQTGFDGMSFMLSNCGGRAADTVRKSEKRFDGAI